MKCFNQNFVRLAGLFFAIILFGAAQAETVDGFREGVDYKLLAKPQLTVDKGKVEVREFFWYGCPHCYSFEPVQVEWLKTIPKDVMFVRTPTVFRKSWANHARAYFAEEVLGITEKVHPELFDAYHKDGRRLDSEEALTSFFVEQGVKESDFRKAFNGFFVDMKLRDAMSKPAKYGITGVPAVVVNGKYRITGSMAGSYTRMTKIIDYLIEKERGSLTAKK